MSVRAQQGAKAENLIDLSRRGFDVPQWSVVELAVFHDFLGERHLAATVDKLLRATTEDTAAQTSTLIRSLVVNASLTPVAREAIRLAYQELPGQPVAVRSSGVEEDGAEFSFAGQFDTFLDVSGFDEVSARVQQCWASAFSERSLRYRLRHGLALTSTGVAVILQTMVAARKSGVLFTANPVTGNRDEYLVSATNGPGDALMSGTVNVDTTTLDASTGAVTDTIVQMPHQPCLTDPELAALHAIGARATESFGAPQDIEWAIGDDRLWVVQSRPITTPLAPPTGELRIWDNSNIIESFHGVTSPLTYTFAADLYTRVYRQYASSLRLPDRALRQMDDWLPAMLGYVHGHVYYNLAHWYRMVRLAPCYRLNRKVLEVSLGVEESLDDEFAESLHPYTSSSRLSAVVTRAVSVAEFARRFFTTGRATRRFVHDFDVAAQAFADIDYDTVPCEEVFDRFRALQRELIERWGPLMALDAALLLSIGTLHLLTRRWLPDAPDWFRWSVSSPGPAVESAEPVLALRRLANTARADPQLARLVFETPVGEVRDLLRSAGHVDFPAAVDDYIEKFGYRSVDELKLETPDLSEDPSSLFTLLRDAVPDTGNRRPDDVSRYLDENLSGPRRWVYDVVRRKTNAGLADRERLRLCRTRAFGMAKRMLRAIGRDLARLGALEDWHDLFYLRLDEVVGCFDGTIDHTEIAALVALRRERQQANALLSPPSRFRSRGAVYWRGNLERAGWGGKAGVDESGDLSRVLHGIPSSPGVVEGTAVIAEEPGDAGGGIVLAYRTDPGWVATLSSASALVIERGSPLTHVAIVARELGIPTVVQVTDLIRRVPAGTRLRVDGGTGVIEVLA